PGARRSTTFDSRRWASRSARDRPNRDANPSPGDSKGRVCAGPRPMLKPCWPWNHCTKATSGPPIGNHDSKCPPERLADPQTGRVPVAVLLVEVAVIGRALAALAAGVVVGVGIIAGGGGRH